MRNFIAAVKMRQYGLPVAAPLAAIYRRRFLFCEQSIYVSEYVEGVNLYEFLKNLPRDTRDRRRIVSGLSEQIAEIFAVLDKKGLWHRDAKATNFIVSGHSPDEYRPVLTDMDGIKQYSVRRRSCQMRPLWQLAASVMSVPEVLRTDYLRMFRAYCEKAAIPAEQRRQLLRELAAKALAKYKHKNQGHSG
jgi:serine/threonine protein kinase